MRTFCTYPTLYRALDDVMTPEGIQPSNFRMFKGALFGRDSEQVGLDLVKWHQSLTDRIIFSLAKLQGRDLNRKTEEEPGKFHHEYRRLYFGGERIDEEQEKLLHQLAERWGGSADEVCYYGSIDSTPQFIRLVAKRAFWHGPEILDRRLRHRSGDVVRLRDSLLAGLGFILRRIEQSDLGLLEFKRLNLEGIRFQVMRDAKTAYLHEDGALANFRAPIASLEVQGLAYDALLDAADLFPEHRMRGEWLRVAAGLRERTLERFWLPDRSYFAMAIDRGEDGKPRLVRTSSSAQAELLETRLFDGLPEDQSEAYLSGIVRLMFGAEFLTQVGIRMRGVSYAHLVPYFDYQGSTVSWALTSNIFARGLRRQELLPAAEEIELRFLRALEITRRFLEFWFVYTDGAVAYRTSKNDRRSAMQIVATNIPERTQAWTVSAALRATLAQDEHAKAAALPKWKRSLLGETMERLAESRRAFVDLEQGWDLEGHRFD